MTQVLWREMAKWGEKASSYFLLKEIANPGTLGADACGNRLSSRNSRVLHLLCKLSAFLVAGGDPVAVFSSPSVPVPGLTILKAPLIFPKSD